MTDARALAQDAEIIAAALNNIADATTNLTAVVQQLKRQLGGAGEAAPAVEYNANSDDRVFIAEDSPEWPAYAAARRAATGKNPPRVQGPNHAPTRGWYFARLKLAKD